MYSKPRTPTTATCHGHPPRPLVGSGALTWIKASTAMHFKKTRTRRTVAKIIGKRSPIPEGDDLSRELQEVARKISIMTVVARIH